MLHMMKGENKVRKQRPTKSCLPGKKLSFLFVVLYAIGLQFKLVIGSITLLVFE